MLMKPPASGDLRAKFADVHIPVPVHLGQAEKCRIQSAPVIKVELNRLLQNAVHIGGGAKIHAAGRDAADGTHLGCEHHALQPLLCRHRGYALRHARCPDWLLHRGSVPWPPAGQ